jgi:hypothetical protein
MECLSRYVLHKQPGSVAALANERKRQPSIGIGRWRWRWEMLVKGQKISIRKSE